MPTVAPGLAPHSVSGDARPALVVAAPAADVERFPLTPFSRYAARNTADAVRLIDRWRPRVVAVDWDAEEFDGPTICAAARQVPGTGILVLTGVPERAPAALKAGCHAVLLKPFASNLLAARLGRLSREMPSAAIATRLADKLGQFGTNRVWPEVVCPTCGQPGAVSFEHASHRRAWYACLACEAVWLGRRQE